MEKQKMDKFIVFKSKIIQTGDYIDASKLLKDAESFVESQKKKLGVKNLGRKNPIQHILNATSGNYVAPTSMKGFMQCPANYLYQKFVPREAGTATSVGTTFHSIMQKWYDLPLGERTIEALNEIKEEFIVKDNQEEYRSIIDFYVNGYLSSGDYLSEGNSTPMNHNNLDCYNEMFVKFNLAPLGVDLNTPAYTLIDRVDIRDNGDIYVIDYKTGKGDPTPYSTGQYGYLPQMIFYKWAIEAEYGMPVKGVYLCIPGADSQEYKYTKMNVDSLVEQSKVVDEIVEYLKKAKYARQTGIFHSKKMKYCRGCKFNSLCNTYNSTNKTDEEILVEIPVLDRVYTEDDE